MFTISHYQSHGLLKLDFFYNTTSTESFAFFLGKGFKKTFHRDNLSVLFEFFPDVRGKDHTLKAI